MRKLTICLLILIHTIGHSQVKIFIGQTKAQVIDYWSTRVSSLYFNEYGESVFIIMKGKSDPEFEAEFDEKGKCFSHYSKITFSEISIMSARLKKAGFIYNSKTESYNNATKKISAKITQIGISDFYILEFESTIKKPVKVIKKSSEELTFEKEELERISAFAETYIGKNAICTFSETKGNCCGWECNKHDYLIRNNGAEVVEVSTYNLADCEGKELFTAICLRNDKFLKSNSLKEIFEKIKKEIEP
jgi:hypothetical protein